jgi:predicted TIM-barrel enzyme
VAFKHQRPVRDTAAAARAAVPYVDVLTTSGAATGVSAPLAKISAMRQATKRHPFAIASGITPENLQNYQDHADCFLVATGVSASQAELDPRRLSALVSAARGF